MGNGKDLAPLFTPGSVAVVGASDRPGKISGVIMESLRAGGFKGEVYPVNPTHETVFGLECRPSISSIEGGVDLAVFAVPAPVVPGLLREAGDSLRAAVIISGGFGESGPEGEALEEEVRAIAEASGVRVVGPNCMGIFNSEAGLDTFFIPHDKLERPRPGPVSIISQSGSFAITAMAELAAEGVGVSKVVSYGNGVDVSEADCLDFLAEDASTGAVAMYMESVTNGRAFVEAASRCSAAKPVMALKVGRHEAGARAARSHTGAITGRYEVYRAAFAKAGVLEAGGYEDFIGGCKAFGMERDAGGGRVAIITDGGGIGVGLADACADMGLEVPSLDAGLAEGLSALFPPFFPVSNPLDLTGSATDRLFADAVEKTLEGDFCDIMIVAALWGPPSLTDGLAGLIGERAAATDKPVIICTPGGEYSRARLALWRKEGLPVFSTPESAVRAAAVLARKGAARGGGAGGGG